MELSQTPVAVLAGGTDFYPALLDKPAPERVLDITRIAGLRGIDITENGWRIGAASTWTDVVQASLPPAFDALKAAAREVGSIQIQNTATVAGNLCNASPAADGVPPLLALNASVELCSVRGRRLLSLYEFILGPRSTALQSDELLVAIHVPSVSNNAQSSFMKLGSRRYLVISIVMACAVVAADDQGNLVDVRASVGSCSAVARRLFELERVLTGQSIHSDLQALITPDLFGALAPIDDVRGSADYRMDAAHRLVCRSIASSVELLRCTYSVNDIDQHQDADEMDPP